MLNHRSDTPSNFALESPEILTCIMDQKRNLTKHPPHTYSKTSFLQEDRLTATADVATWPDLMNNGTGLNLAPVYFI